MAETKAEETIEPVSLRQLFRFATFLDMILLLVGGIAAVGMGILQPIMFYLLGAIFSELGPSTTADDYYDSASELCLYLVYFGLAYMVVAAIAVSVMITVGARQGFHYRMEYFRKIMSLDNAWFDSKVVAELPTSLSSDVMNIEKATGDKLIIFIFTFAMIVASFLFAFISDLKLTLIALAFGPLVIFGLFLTNHGMVNSAMSAELSYKKAGGVAEEALSEIKTVAAFNGQKHEATKYTEFLKISRKAMTWNGMQIGLGMGIAILAANIQMATLFIVGAQDIEDGEENWATGEEIDAGNVLTVLFVSIMAFNNTATLVPAFQAISQGRVAAARVMETLRTEPLIVDGSTKREIEGAVEFRGVHFCYPTATETPVLKGVDFKIERGQRLGVVGSTGSGKSTIIQLLLRFYTPDSGQILIDGVPIEGFNVSQLRNKIGIVSQEPLLFNTTLHENIRYGCLDASENDIRAAAEQAGAIEFIEKLPDKYQTSVGAKGSQLSGGQKQRIALARAIIRRPAILLLDEATSALDKRTETSVLQSLDHALPNCTRISVAQNLLTIRDSTAIIFLEQGTIIEAGNHDTLMEKQGKYFHLVRMQEIQQQQQMDEAEEEKDSSQQAQIMSASDLDIKQKEDGGQYIKKIMAMNRKNWHWVLIAILGSFFLGCSYPISGVFIGRQINLMSKEEGSNDMVDDSVENSLYMILVGFVMFTAVTFQSTGYPRVSTDVTIKIREDGFRALLSYDVPFFDMPENNASALGTRLSTDCETVNSLGGSLIGLIIGMITALAVAHGVAAYFSWRISLVALSLVPIVIFAMSAVFMAQMKGLVDCSYSDSGPIASDAILNYKTVKAFNLEGTVLDMYRVPVEQEVKAAKSKGISSGITFGLGFGLLFFVYALLFWYGAKIVRDEGVKFEDMFIAIFTAIMASDTFFLAGTFAGDVPGGVEAAKRLFKILEYKPSINVKDKSGEKPEIRGAIEFQNVSFSYPNRTYQALKNVSFKVNPSSRFAIIGRTGSGKSTIVQLIQRLYDPSSGVITLDGLALDAYNLKYLRSCIGTVSQEPVLFTGTIAENIAYGIHASEDEIERAAELAQATEFISKSKHGFKREVGLKGSKLSGGQKQRIAIARAIVRKPALMIFDEATSALDSQTESAVISNMHGELGKSTWLMIAHRLKTISEADTILVMESGRILEYGPRESLYNQQGYFYNMISNL